MNKEKVSKKNRSVERAFKIIETMSLSNNPTRLKDIAFNSNLNESTVLRFLDTLVACNYIKQNLENSMYSLSMKFCYLGESIHSQIKIRDIIKPFLIELSEESQESACLAIEDDMMAVYIDVIEGPDNIIRSMQRIGKKAPLHSTAVGKLLLLNYPKEDLKTLVKNKGLEKLTRNTITDLDELILRLEKIRDQGYAMDDEECELGARCVAVPVKDYTGKIVAAMSITGPTNRLTFDRVKYLKPTLLKLSIDASKSMGFDLF